MRQRTLSHILTCSVFDPAGGRGFQPARRLAARRDSRGTSRAYPSNSSPDRATAEWPGARASAQVPSMASGVDRVLDGVTESPTLHRRSAWDVLTAVAIKCGQAVATFVLGWPDQRRNGEHLSGERDDNRR